MAPRMAEEDVVDKERGGRQHQGIDRSEVCQVPEGNRELETCEKTGYKLKSAVVRQ